MAQFEPDCGGSPHGATELHKKIEAMKLASIPISTSTTRTQNPLTCRSTGSFPPELRGGTRGIDRSRESGSVWTRPGNPQHGDTTYLAAVDKEGNITSLIQSNFANFGAGVVVNGMGFLLQNRGGLFTLDAAHGNALEPRKRPFHTIIPAFMESAANIHIRIWNYGRGKPAAGPCPIRLECG